MYRPFERYAGDIIYCSTQEESKTNAEELSGEDAGI